MCACGQWSRSHPGRATLVRHVLLQATTTVATITARTAPLAPAPRPFGVGYPAPPRPLVPACALTPSRVVRQASAVPATVAVATIAVAAQHDLHTAERAQEQAPWSIHAHLGQEPKLQCWTDASQRCHTDAAPPSSARCRARYGCQASGEIGRCRAHLLRHERCCIPSAGPYSGHTAEITTHPDPRRPRWHCAHTIGCACPAALQGGRAGAIPPTHRSISSKSKPPPHQRIDAVADQRSQSSGGPVHR